MPHLEFFADETRTYTIEASTDLANWQEIGIASQAGAPGNFDFDDQSSNELDARYYRVVSQ